MANEPILRILKVSNVQVLLTITRLETCSKIGVPNLTPVNLSNLMIDVIADEIQYGVTSGSISANMSTDLVLYTNSLQPDVTIEWSVVDYRGLMVKLIDAIGDIPVGEELQSNIQHIRMLLAVPVMD